MSQGYKYRAQILLEPEQHKKLAEIAAREHRSVSDVVREAVAEYMVTQEKTREAQEDVFDRIRRLHASILERRGGKPIEIDTVELINQMREERDNEILARMGNIKNDRG
jgi:Arc/MetJ-type ribon-helix-helix transcriptional regulator